MRHLHISSVYAGSKESTLRTPIGVVCTLQRLSNSASIGSGELPKVD
jgi:hypothetical protein